MSSKPTIQISGTGRMFHYRAAITAAGGEPLAGYAPAPDLSCAGLVLCGGEDVAPHYYGQEDRGSGPPDLVRDEAELALFDAFFRAGKPILAICRGMQLVNVALGGTLIQDLPRHLLPFHTGTEDRIHPIRTADGSLLHQLLGPTPQVNSYHHQAVDRLGEGLRAEGWSEGGIVEGAVHESHPLIAVQFHPERMAFEKQRPDAADAAPLFHHFLSLCRG